MTTTITGSPTDAAKSSSSLSITSTAASTGIDDAASTTDQSNAAGLSSGARTGAIAGGVAGAAILVVLLLVGFLCFRRRQRKRYLKREEERAVENFMNEGVISKGGSATEADPLNLGIMAGQSPPSATSSPDTPALSELDSKAARPWSLRSELDNSASARSSYNTAGSHCGGGGGVGQARHAPSELAAHPIAELPG